MKNTIIFSDVHLKTMGEDMPARESFRSFLRSIDPARTERLICLGDLFDFWYEYRHVLFSGYFDVLRVFADLNEAGVELHLICGNHDFWAGKTLKTLFGFHVHHEPVRLRFGDKEALLLHGDGLNPKDYGYRIFKRIARNPLVMRLMRCLHPDLAMSIARHMSHASRAALKISKPSESPEVEIVREHVHRLLHDGVADIVFCGHVHVPVIEHVPVDNGVGLHINPGDWPHHRSYVVFEDGEFILRYFECTEQKPPA